MRRTPFLTLLLVTLLGSPQALAKATHGKSHGGHTSHAAHGSHGSHGTKHAQSGRAAALRAQQRALRDKQAKLAQRLGEQRAKTHALAQKESSASAELSTLQQRLEQTSTELTDSQYRLRKAQDKLAVTQVKLAGARQNFEQQQHAAGGRLRAMYKNQALDQWESMLAAPDMATFLTRYHYFKRIGDHDAKLLDQLDRQRDAIKDQQHEFAAQRQSIARITEVIGSQKVQLTGLALDKADMVSKIKTDRQVAEQFVEQLEADSNQVGVMIQRMLAEQRALEQAARARNPSYVHFLGTGRFSMPVHGATISSPFGWRMHPIAHTMKLHTGIDFAVGSGTPIYAPDSGECMFAGPYGGYGNCVIINHGHDLSTLYGHTSRYVVHSGERITKGQVIAYVGSTGNSTGPHLHFEVRLNGTPVNPGNYLR